MKTKLAVLIFFCLSIFYMVWHLGRWYGQTEDQKAFYSKDSLTADAYNYYLLTKCLKGELSISDK
jgi:hypothetical protein